MTAPKAVQRITCNRCRVGYAVKPRHGRSTVYRCPDCNLRFHEAMRPDGTYRLGVTPEDKAEWLDDGLK